MLADQFLFRTRQFFRSQTFARQLPNLVEQCGLHRFDFLRISPEIKRKETGNEPLHLACANVISQAHLLANANKEARSKIAACLFDQIECMSILIEDVYAAIANHDHALRFFLVAFDTLDIRDRRGGTRVG